MYRWYAKFKIISLYQCHHLEDPENWGLYKNNIINDNNMFINNCLLSKYDTNCYKICSFYYYYDENLNRYICIEDLKCPEPYNYLIHDKNECIKSCDETNDYQYEILQGKVCLKNCSDNFYEPYDRPFEQRQNELCITYYIYSKEVNNLIFDKVISQTRNELLNNFDESIVNGGMNNKWKWR